VLISSRLFSRKFFRDKPNLTPFAYCWAKWCNIKVKDRFSPINSLMYKTSQRFQMLRNKSHNVVWISQLVIMTGGQTVYRMLLSRLCFQTFGAIARYPKPSSRSVVPCIFIWYFRVTKIELIVTWNMESNLLKIFNIICFVCTQNIMS